MGKLIGYARVSTGEQDLQLQLDALKTAGCSNDDIYMDKASGARGSRPGLDACVAALEPGDTLIVWRLDRLGRSMPHLVGLVEELPGKGIDFRSLLDGAIDTTTASGDLMFNIFSSLAQFERRLIQERTPGRLGRRPGTRAKGRSAADQPRRPACRDRQAPASGPRADHRPDLQDLGDFQANVLPISGAAKRHQ